MEEIVEEPQTVTLYPSLLETPEFREAIDTRSKTVEDVLNVLKKGTYLWKVRSFSKWYRRKYFLDDKNGTLVYEPTRKPPCYGAPVDIVVDDIIDIRKGWKTDMFNKIEKKVEKKRIKYPAEPPILEETKCFSIIHGQNKQSIDLVAPSQATADMWVRGLHHLVTVLKGLQQEERFERWIEQQFNDADVDNNKCLNFEESLKLLKQLNVKMPKNEAKNLFQEANTNKNTRDGEQVLDADEFVAFFMKLMARPEIKTIFSRYSKNGEDLSKTELCNFINKEQKVRTITEDQCLTLIEAFEQSEMKDNGKMSLIGFTNMLMSERFEIFNEKHKIVYQDMSQPLSHYYIASSHNTYLTGGQLSGESSVEGYIDALKMGCRCLELDVWDGPDGEPIIYHGYTLTSKILFKDVLVDAIKPYAFIVSVYPVILSLEVHCTEPQQETMSKYMVEVLGDMLYVDNVNENMESLPSPEALKFKIIVKAKKRKPEENAVESDESTDEEDGECEGKDDSRVKERRKKANCTIATGLSNLVNICQAVHFHGFEYTKENGKCYQMSSFSEAKAEKLIENSGQDFVAYNIKHLSRIYPAGTRTSSSNYKPTPFWYAGCQLVALNYQHASKPMFFNEAKFRQNGSCGYVLKPDYLRNNSGYDPASTLGDRSQVMFVLKIISGQHIPKPDQDTDGDIVDPYVKVKILGHPKDSHKERTDSVRNNGFNPNWNHEMVFNIKMPELAIVHFVVKDMNTTGRNATLGSYALPFLSIEEGYRHVYLMDYTRNYVSPASLFIHVSIIK